MTNEEIEKLKKGYWGNLAAYSFRERDNLRLFSLGGIFTKKFYVIDSDETEIILRKKLIKQYQIVLGIIMAVVVLCNSSFLTQWPIFFSFLLIVLIIQKICLKVMLDGELKKLRTLEAGISIKDHFKDISRKHSKATLWFGFLGSLGFVVLGLVSINMGLSAVVGVSGVLFFGLCALGWGYALLLKKK